MTRPDDVRTYDRDRALWIAEQYADGDATLKQLHQLHPETVPAPFWLYRWRQDYPEFDQLMIDAERCRAGAMADDILTVVDAGGPAAERRVRMQGRQWLAERFDRDRFSPAARVDHKHSGTVHVERHELSDAQLERIIAAEQQPAAIEGEAQAVTRERAREEHGAAAAGGPPAPPEPGDGPRDFLIPSDSSPPITTSVEKISVARKTPEENSDD